MSTNRIWTRAARRRDGRPGRGAKGVGPLALPLPSGAARAESLDDGSLQIVDALPVGRLGEFVGALAGWVRDGTVEPPASFALAVRDGMSVRFERGAVTDDAAERMAAAMEGIGESIREGRVDPQSFAMSLDCGCGLRVSRDDGAGGPP